ncbi:hypothetical protein ElyMa_001785400, partial [Elysia marginata]
SGASSTSSVVMHVRGLQCAKVDAGPKHPNVVRDFHGHTNNLLKGFSIECGRHRHHPSHCTATKIGCHCNMLFAFLKIRFISLDKQSYTIQQTCMHLKKKNCQIGACMEIVIGGCRGYKKGIDRYGTSVFIWDRSAGTFFSLSLKSYKEEVISPVKLASAFGKYSRHYVNIVGPVRKNKCNWMGIDIRDGSTAKRCGEEKATMIPKTDAGRTPSQVVPTALKHDDSLVPLPDSTVVAGKVLSIMMPFYGCVAAWRVFWLTARLCPAIVSVYLFVVAVTPVVTLAAS